MLINYTFHIRCFVFHMKLSMCCAILYLNWKIKSVGSKTTTIWQRFSSKLISESISLERAGERDLIEINITVQYPEIDFLFTHIQHLRTTTTHFKLFYFGCVVICCSFFFLFSLQIMRVFIRNKAYIFL